VIRAYEREMKRSQGDASGGGRAGDEK